MLLAECTNGGRFNPVERIGFGYAVTGFADGLNGDQMRGVPIIKAMQGTPMLPVSNTTTSAQPKL